MTFLVLILIGLTVFNRPKLEIEPVFDPDDVVIFTNFDDNAVKESSSCPDDMVHVEGAYCPDKEEICLKWLDKDQSPTANSGIGPMRCAEFQFPTKCLSKRRIQKDFCMDRYEFKNQKDELPIVSITWIEAKQSCESLGKRLCTDSEWTFACEGEDMKPYPYLDGYHRNEEICDQTHTPMPVGLPQSEWPKYYQGHLSGSFPLCVSPFGVYDMVSGVDEWVVNESKNPYVSSLKGGYGTNRVRTRCSVETTAHGPEFKYYQVGTRCCKDAQ